MAYKAIEGFSRPVAYLRHPLEALKQLNSPLRENEPKQDKYKAELREIRRKPGLPQGFQARGFHRDIWEMSQKIQHRRRTREMKEKCLMVL